MTITLDLETWFKVTAHLCPKDLFPKVNEPDLATGRDEDKRSWTEKRDGKTDRLITKGRPQSGPIFASQGSSVHSKNLC